MQRWQACRGSWQSLRKLRHPCPSTPTLGAQRWMSLDVSASLSWRGSSSCSCRAGTGTNDHVHSWTDALFVYLLVCWGLRSG